jgi:hypothetical protein
MEHKILKELKENKLISIANSDGECITICDLSFFGAEQEFWFECDTEEVYSCKAESEVFEKIKEYVNKGFVLVQD